MRLFGLMLFSLFLVSSIFGCATYPGNLTHIVDPSRIIYFQGFSVLPPQGEGWFFAGKNQLSALMSKELSSKHTVGALVTTYALEEAPGSQKELEEYIESNYVKLAGDRHVNPEISFSPGPEGSLCTLYRWMVTDRGVPKENGADYTMSAQGKACVHPDYRRMVIDLSVSQRTPPSMEQLDLSAEVQPFLTSLEFDKLERPLISTIIHAGRGLNCIASGHEAVWVADVEGSSIIRIDPAKSEVVARIKVDRGPVGITVTEDAVWCTSQMGNSVTRIDPGTNEVTAGAKVGKGPLGIAAGAGSLWTANSGSGTVTRLSAETLEVEAEIEVGTGPTGITLWEGYVWVTNFGDGRIVKIDPASNKVVGDGIAVGCGLQIPDGGQEALWVPAHCEEFSGVIRIDKESDSIAQKIPFGSVPSSARFINGTVWIADAGGSLFRIDPTENKTVGRMVPIGAEAIDLTYSHGSVWVSSYNGSVYRIESD